MANKFPSSTKFSFQNNSKFKTDRVNGEEAEKEEDGWVSIQEDLNNILVEMYLPDADHGIGKAVPQNKQPNAPSQSSNSSSSFTPLSISIPPPVVGCPSAPRNKVRYLQSKVKKDTRNEKIYSQATQQQVFGKASGFVYQLKLCRKCYSSGNMLKTDVYQIQPTPVVFRHESSPYECSVCGAHDFLINTKYYYGVPCMAYPPTA